MSGSIIVTMAGRGSRFREVGYDVPKYAISVRGKTLFEWSMLSLRDFLRAGYRVCFVTLAENHSREFLERMAPTAGVKQLSILELSEVTDGQATTAIRASAIVPRDEPVAIYNIDTYVRPEHLRAEAARGDGWIPCFPGRGDAWSFAETDSTGRVISVREKLRVSPHATVGLYWFRTLRLFEQAYHDYYSKASNLERGEKYVAPLYNWLVARGGDVRISSIPYDAVYPLGTPKEVEEFATKESA